VRVAWDNFRKSVKSAKSEYKKAHNQAWNTFVKDRKKLVNLDQPEKI
jgi:hypothetical protein